MAAANQPRSFADTGYARLIALAIAVGIGVLFYVYWERDIRALFTEQAPEIPILAKQQPITGTNPALQACLDERVGDVERMKAEGVINDAQYTTFRQRAEDLCRAQNVAR